MTSDPAVVPEPDTKDWTWVLERPCAECGYAAAELDRGEIGALVRENAAFWAAALTDPRARRRPSADIWSPTEYACHVRDVNRIFHVRLERMLIEPDPLFADWDQDETAVADRYDLQAPEPVASELVAAAEQVAELYDDVSGADWQRPGTRSNGSAFTVETLGRYHLHDLVHHRWDVRWLLTP